MPTPLPVDDILPALLEHLAREGAVVLESPPGSGKTTRVPIAVASAVPGQVWVLEPRRVAARAAAQRVATELGESVGEQVGYAMRLDRKSSDKTRVLYVTEGVFTRRLDDLAGIDAVVLDEFHERSIHADVALAWCRALRGSRPDLKLVVMSATLDGDAVARFLGCPRVRATGTMFPVDIRYWERRDDRPIEARVAAACREALPSGSVLAFLPGIGEIERAAALLGGVDVYPLHGEVDGAGQDRALREGARPRVVLATNVAETSVTVEGIATVIDTGLARQAAFDPWSGLPTLDLVPIARDSAAQRAGRAGRLGPGACLRLYSRADHDARPAQTPPEIRRIDLAATVLALRGRPLDWFEAPPPGAWKAAVEHLRRLDLIDDGGLTVLGEAVSRLPLSPRLGRLLVEAAALGWGREGAGLVALFGRRLDGDLVDRALDGQGDAREKAYLSRLAPSHGHKEHDGLARALFAAFPDRVGQRQGGRVKLGDGGAAECESGRDGYVIVTEVDRVHNRARARTMTPIPEGWLLDHATVRDLVRWTGDRVEVREELVYGELVLDAAPGQGDPAEVGRILHEHVVANLHNLVPDWDGGAALVARVAFLRRQGVDLPVLDLDTLGRALCGGRRSARDLGQASLVELARGQLSDPALVDRLAPATIRLPGRPRAAVNYEGDEPHVASRMQDFFGLADGPRILDGKYPLVLHLNAPSGRPVQVTRDLPGFWARHYPGIRRELMRRYPRHKWPEDPRALYSEQPEPSTR